MPRSQIFNFTDLKFATRLYIGNTKLETVTQTKLLGTVIRSDLKWKSNTEMITKKGYMRMMILHKLFEFNVPITDIDNIYNLYIRSVLEQSCVVWHHSITEDESNDLERVQKVACKVILSNRYESYS